MLFSSLPFPAVNMRGERHRCMALRERVVYPTRSGGRQRRLSHDLGGFDQPEPSKHRVTVRQPRIGERICLVNFYSPLEVLDPLFVSIAGPLVPMEASSQIEPMGLGVIGVV